MDSSAALAIVRFIAHRTGGTWERGTIEAWTEEISALADTFAAEEAAQVLAHGHTGGFKPSYGDFRELYETAARRRAAAVPAIGAGSVGPTMSLSEYLPRLYARVQRGDRAAASEWDNWRNHLLRPPAATQRSSWVPGWEDARAVLRELVSLSDDPGATAP